MMIAQRRNKVRKRYKRSHRGEEQEMLAKYMKRISERECPIVLSITDTTQTPSGDTVIQRNNIRMANGNDSVDIYVRAREIYYRARRHRPVRAASIF